MARSAGTTKKATASRASSASKKGAGKNLRANSQQPKRPAEEPAEPLMTATTAHDIAGVVLAVIGVASFIAVISPASAPITRAISEFFHLGFGLGAYVLPLGILAIAAIMFLRDRPPVDPRTVSGIAIIFIALLAALTLIMNPEHLVLGVTVGEGELARSGGYVGFAIASALSGALGKVISLVIVFGVLVLGLVLVGFSVSDLVQGAVDRAARLAERRHIDVNDRPWGESLDELAHRKQAPHKTPRAAAEQMSLFDEDGSAPTTFIGNRETTVLDLDAEDEDDDPFVDVSDQLAAEQAKTTIIPPRPVKPARRNKKTAAAAPLDATISSAPTTVLGGAAAEVAMDDDLPPFDLEEKADAPAASAEAAPTTVLNRGTDVPEFLKHPKTRPAAHEKAPVDLEEAAVDVARPDASGDVANTRQIAPSDTTSEDSTLALPPASMLRHNPHSASSASSNKELEQTASSLQSTLAEFNLHSKVVGWISGPTVTTFKVQPGEGERVSRISSLEDDIALSLAAQSVRIFAPIPGTSLVGIEIPNRKRQNVNLGDVLPYVKGGPLELAIGRDAEGAPIVADLAKMPHLLIAGTTGSGKSVMINSIVVALLMRTRPEDVRLIMVDPKRVELAGYNGLPHLYVPVVTEPKQAASALQWAVSEMERRLKVFERLQVRKISTYNEKQASGVWDSYDNPPQKMPYLVIIIDELSDLMMVAGKDVEASIVRIAQLGRAAGIHLIVATQRPSSNVVTGLIKANITNRIAFNVATGIDSRVIIDQVGAEKLTGYGDMLFSKVDWGKPKRIQGCFVSDDEINSVVEFVKSQADPDYHEEILSAVAPAMLGGGGGGGHDASDDDPLMWEAAHIVVESQLGSTSGLQRRLKVGYARAGRIMDMLEEKGVVGPPDGSKPREVLLDEEGLAELEAVEARMAADDGMGGM